MKFLFLFIIAFIFYGTGKLKCKKELFPGKKFIYVYKNYKAVVIVDNSIICKGDRIYYEDFIVSGRNLAKACAIGMYETNKSWVRLNTPKLFNKNKTIKEFVVLFLGKEEFDKSSKVVGYKVDEARAFAAKFTKKYPYDGPYGCVVNANELKRTEIWGVACIHEYIHCLSNFYLDDWDYEHKLWKTFKEEGIDKHLGLKAAENTYIKLNVK